MKQPTKARPDVHILAEGILHANRVLLSQAITLIESNLEEDEKLSTGLLEKIIHASGNSIRIGITGVPGVGKSTFIEAFGKYITSLGKKLAILTVDPSSPITRGSILGDKTRMGELSVNPLAYIRPTAAGNALGGIANKTHDVMLLCEAAGYEVIIIETVGVGQSEVSVKNSVDFFLLLMLAGAGDELQGIKKGIMEMADAIVITKADGDNIHPANAAKATHQQALHMLMETASGWSPKVITTSALTGSGIGDVWKIISSYHERMIASGFFSHNRRMQNIAWFNDCFKQLQQSDLMKFQDLQIEKKKLEVDVSEQKVSARTAAERLLQFYHRAIRKSNQQD